MHTKLKHLIQSSMMYQILCLNFKNNFSKILKILDSRLDTIRSVGKITSSKNIFVKKCFIRSMFSLSRVLDKICLTGIKLFKLLSGKISPGKSDEILVR